MDSLHLIDTHYSDDHGFVGVVYTSVFVDDIRPGLAHSPDGLEWSHRAVAGIPKSLARTDDRWITLGQTATKPGAGTNFVAISEDLDHWTTIDVSSLKANDEDLTFYSVAMSGDQIVLFGERWKDHPTRPKPPSCVVAAGPLGGPLTIKKAPVHTMESVVDTPTGFVAVGHGARAKDRSRVFSSVDGLEWIEIAHFEGWGGCVRFGDLLVAGGGSMMNSKDWGATWSAIDAPTALHHPSIHHIRVGPAGIAIEIHGSTTPADDGQEFGELKSAIWFSADGSRYSEIDFAVGQSADSATFLVAVGAGHILITKRTYTNPPTAEWIRVPVPKAGC